jgi:hypothetical protein
VSLLRRRRAPEPSARPLLAVGLAGLAAGAAAALLLERALKRPKDGEAATRQGLAAGAAILALAVALDSGLEHYRGGFENKAMFVAPTLAAATLAAALPMVRSGAESGLQRIAFGAAIAAGAAGTGFHVYDLLRRPGGIDLQNLFYYAPLGAPAALGLAGLYGLLAAPGATERLEAAGVDAKYLLAPLIGLSLLGTAAEAGILHFRGAFQNPAMYAPVTVPPLAALAIGLAPFLPEARKPALYLLRATAALGFAGPLFHAYGIHRNMGGWRNWSQMILQGPPLPAPPAFTAIAVAGLGVIGRIDEGAAVLPVREAHGVAAA